MSDSDASTFFVYLDRVEHDMGVLLCGEANVVEWLIPKAWLPTGARPGDRLSCRIECSPSATSAAAMANQALRRDRRE